MTSCFNSYLYCYKYQLTHTHLHTFIHIKNPFINFLFLVWEHNIDEIMKEDRPKFCSSFLCCENQSDIWSHNPSVEM